MKKYNAPLTEVVEYNGKAVMVQFGLEIASDPATDNLQGD